METIKVVNQVVTTELKHRLNLDDLALKLTNIEYNPEQFPGLVMRIKDPKSSALLFSSGKIVCTGTINIIDAEKAVIKIIHYLKKAGIEIKIKPLLTIQNMVGTANLKSKLSLDNLALELGNTEYKPHKFPGLVYKISLPFKASFLLFSNGKLVCTGTKNPEELKKCIAQLISTLEKLGKKRFAS